tara:strand:- start:787 stop:1158 length:372 start_codon:yes stop_codon:yes gene_type:complete
MISRKRSKKKVTGGLYKDRRKKRLSEAGRLPTLTHVGETKLKQERVRGGNDKQRLLKADHVAVVVDGKHVKAKVKTVSENPANRNFVRRNILTKGTILSTDKGKVRITSRPGQSGSLQGVIVK